MNRNLVAACALLAAGCSEFDLQNNPDADVAPAPDILVTPSALEFGLLSTGDKESQTFNVQNVGDSTLHVSNVVIGAGIAFEIKGPSTTFDLEPGEATDVEVKFEPMGADENFGQALVLSDDPDSPEEPVDLLGYGAVPELEITPSSYVFPEAVVPCGDSVDLQLKNVGTEDLVITDWSYTSDGLLVLDDAAARALLPITLAPGETGALSVDFLPSTLGMDFGTLSVVSNDPRGTVEADQNGEGVYIETRTESFTEPGVPPVDVMLLIDHSCSMEDANQADIEAGMPDFIAELQTVADYHLALVTLDNGCATGGYMTNSTPNQAQTIIDHAWDASGGLFGGYLTEALLELASIALSKTDPGECNDGFLRPGALLHIIVISDEPEQSGNTALSWVTDYRTYVTADEFVKVSGVIDYDNSCGAAAEFGAGYVDAINNTGGSSLQICDANWGANFSNIASEVLAGSRTYNLSDEADPASVVVVVNGVPTTDIDVTGSAVTVNSPPVGEGDEVEITYGVLADCN